MMEEYALPLLLAKSMGEVRGKTRFQKLLYIIQKRSRKAKLPLKVFAYKPYLYGPFSVDLARTLDQLVALQLLGQKSGTTSAGYTIVTYALAPKGKEFLERIAATKHFDSKILSVINDVSKSEGGMPLVDLIAAAKAL